MRLDVQSGIIRGIPLALLVTFLVQGGAAVWWLSAKARDSLFLEQRVEHLEGGFLRINDDQGQIFQRLARIEERANAQLVYLDRIDKNLLAHLTKRGEHE